jgi:signal peptidase I
VLLQADQAKLIQKVEGIEQIRLLDDPRVFYGKPIFPFSERNEWTLNDYGPYVIPSKGYTIELTFDNLRKYMKIIEQYESCIVEVRNNIVFINDIESRFYTFRNDYYFLLSDNRDHGEDSRTFGIVPEEYLQGKIIWTF